MNRLIIIGASGHGKVIVDIAKLNGYTDIVFLDDDVTKTECCGYPVVGPISALPSYSGDVVVAIGDTNSRKNIVTSLNNRNLPTLIHPNASITEQATIGSGTVIMAGAVINPDTVIGKGVILNTACSVDHDCQIEDFVHIAVGAHVCGNVIIGDGTWIGAGTIVSNNVKICSNCLIGAGSVVVKDIETPGTYVGVPAKLLVK